MDTNTVASLIVGLSGGSDSVYLLHWLIYQKKTSKRSIIAAHLDHEWRSESHQDARFCRNMCQQLGIQYVEKRLSELDWKPPKNRSREAIGRAARRHFLESVMYKYGAKAIYLGHHADDQEETFLLRLIRGASLTGLTAMKPQAGVYVRPLLQLRKEQILHYLHTHAIHYREDPSNKSHAFLRNRIRHQVLPALHASDQRFHTNFARTLHKLQETEIWIESIVHEAWKRISNEQNGRYALNLSELLVCKRPLLERLLIKWCIVERVPFEPSQRFLDEIIRFLQQPKGGTHHIYPTWSLTKQKNHTFITQQWLAKH